MAVLLYRCFWNSSIAAIQQDSVFLSEILTEKFSNKSSNQIQIVQHNVPPRELILPCKKQGNVAKARVSDAGRSQHYIVASGTTSLKLLFFLLEVLRVLRGCPAHL